MHALSRIRSHDHPPQEPEYVSISEGSNVYYDITHPLCDEPGYK